MRIRKVLAEKIGEALDAEIDYRSIEMPDGDRGDYAFPAMRAASEKGENPRELAERAVPRLEEEEAIDSVEVAGPGFVNIFLDRAWFASRVQDLIEAERMEVEQHEGGLLLEFSSPNVAKPMHVGHFRNNVLGDSLQRIMRFAGFDVTSENYLGDWGTQYGKLIYAFKEFGSREAFEDDPMKHMYSLYVKFHEEMEDDEELEEKGREWAAKIEDGDEEAVRLWEMFRDASMEYHKQDYRRMGIAFDRWTGESTVVDGAREMVESWIEQGELARDEDGSVFMEFDDEDLPGTVLLKADGSTLYITRDLYNLKKRNGEGFDHNFYVVGSEQELHFKQVFAAAARLGLDPSGSEHISYGLLSLPEGSMSSREGRIITLRDTLNEAVEKAEGKAEEKMERKPENAEAIGIGAVRYANLSVSRKKDIRFDWDRALSFEGDSGPYLQYSNVRAKGILEKADGQGRLAGRPGDEEYNLLQKLAGFPLAVERSVDSRDPVKIATYLSELCEVFNTFYHSCPVLDAAEETRLRRLALVEMFVEVTETGMELLGIETLEEM